MTLCLMAWAGVTPVMAQGLPEDLDQAASVPLAAEEVPLHGTFWFAQKAGLPPLPWNPFPDLPVYAWGTNWFLVDDRTVDYVALREAREMEAALVRLEEEAGLATMSSEPPPPPGDGGGTDTPPEVPPAFQLGDSLGFIMPELSPGGLSFSLSNSIAGEAYDLYYTTNLSPNLEYPELSLTNWAWLARGAESQTLFTMTNLVFDQCYFRAGTLLDSDSDGLPDAYERIVSHTATNFFDLVSSDGQGTPDAWYLRQRLSPEAGGDADGDGLVNWREYRLGGDPRAAAAFQIWVSSPP